MVIGDMPALNSSGPLQRFLISLVLVEAFWRMVILCFGVPQFGITAVLVRKSIDSLWSDL